MRHSTTPIGRRTLTAGLGLALAMPAIRRVRAATPIALGYTATLGFSAAFIARDRGIFARNGLDVNLILITLNSNIPGALVGGSIQIGGPTPTVMLQADDGGLDMVIVSGCSAVDPANKVDGLLARTDVTIAKAADCIGKKIGVPGLNAYYHVMVRKWMDDNGVDWRRANFVEVPFTQSADVLRSGSVDAVATGEPFSRRIISDGIGRAVVAASDVFPAGTPSLFYAATRSWSRANAGAVQAFRRSIGEAIRFQADDPAAARDSAAKFIRLPPEVMASISTPPLQSETTPGQVAFWIDLMAKQGMIQDKPDPAKLLTP